MFNPGDVVATTVHMIGGRQEDVTGIVTRVNMSRKVPTRVLSYVVDASAAGYGELSVPAADARGTGVV